MKTAPQKQNRNSDEQDASRDPIWDLLRRSPSSPVSADFADRVVMAARQADATPPLFWSRTRLMVSAVTGMAAALAIAAMVMVFPDSAPLVAQQQPDVPDAFASLDEVANQEMLLAATDHLGEFSDTELVSLIGF